MTTPCYTQPKPRSPFVAMAMVMAGIGIARMLSGAKGGGTFRAIIASRRATKAKELYLAQCDVALANPSLSAPEPDTLDCEARRLAGSKDAFERYEWYVARLIYTLDECLRLNPEGQWEAVARTQLGSHKAYLSSDYYAKQGYIRHYSPRLQSLIEQRRH